MVAIKTASRTQKPQSSLAVSRRELSLWTMFFFAISGALSWINALQSFALFVSFTLAALYGLGLIRNSENVSFATIVIFLCPLFAPVSYFWSLNPGSSLYYGTQFFFTALVGYMCGRRLELDDMLRCIFTALFLAAIISVFVIAFKVDLYYDDYSVGLFPHKNVAGAVMALLLLTALSLFLFYKRSMWFIVASLLSAYLIYYSRSTTSLLAATICGGSVLAIHIIQKCRPLVLLSLGSLALSAASLCALIIVFWNLDLVEGVFDLLGKDRSFTGRTLIWNFGLRSFYDNAFLGVGYAAFFSSTQTTGALIRYMISQQIPYLHNNFLEVAVALGSVGIIFFLASLILYLINCLRVCVSAFNQVLPTVWHWTAVYFIYLMIFCITENPLMAGNSLTQVLFVAAFTMLSRVLVKDNDHYIS